MHVDGGEDKGSQSESRKTQRGGVGELAVLIWPPCPRLESTTKGLSILANGHLIEVAVVVVCEALARYRRLLLDTVGLLLIGSDVDSFVSHGDCRTWESIDLMKDAKCCRVVTLFEHQM